MRKPVGEMWISVLAGTPTWRGTPSPERRALALEQLRTMSGKDFGYDIERWKAWYGEYEAQSTQFRVEAGRLGSGAASSLLLLSRALEHGFSAMRRRALEDLRKISGKDFGDNLDQWEAWLPKHEAERNEALRQMTPAKREVALLEEAEEFRLYTVRLEALRKLREMAGEDLGYDLERWKTWSREQEGESGLA